MPAAAALEKVRARSRLFDLCAVLGAGDPDASTRPGNVREIARRAGRCVGSLSWLTRPNYLALDIMALRTGAAGDAHQAGPSKCTALDWGIATSSKRLSATPELAFHSNLSAAEVWRFVVEED